MSIVSSLRSSLSSSLPVVEDAVPQALFTKVSNPADGTISNGGLTISGDNNVFFSSPIVDQSLLDGGSYAFDFVMDLSSFASSSTTYIGFGDGDSIGGGGLTQVLTMALSKTSGGALEIQASNPFVPEALPATPVSLTYAGEVMSIVIKTTGGVTNCKIYQGTTLLIDEDFSYTFTVLDRMVVYIPTTAGSIFDATLQTGELPVAGTQITVTP